MIARRFARWKGMWTEAVVEYPVPLTFARTAIQNKVKTIGDMVKQT